MMKTNASALVIASLAALAVAAWAPPVFRTVVYIHSSNDGHAFTVNRQPVESEHLELQTLEHAIRDNPRMRVADIYEDSLIVVCADSEVSIHLIKEVEERLAFDGFGNIHLGASYECADQR